MASNKRKFNERGSGVIQQLSIAAEPDRTGMPEHSELALFLMKSVFWGEVSIAFVVTVVVLACNEYPKHPDMLKLSAMEAAGPTNSSSQFWKKLSRFPLEAANKTFQIPARVPFNPLHYINFTMMMPHLVFATLYKSYPFEFCRRFAGGLFANISAFWEAQKDHPALEGHDMKKHHRCNYKKFAILLFSHGDDVATTGVGRTWSKSIAIISWGSLLVAAGHPRLSAFVISVLLNYVSTSADPQSTEGEIWKVLCWSLYWLYQGVYPDADPSGVMYTVGEDFIRKLDPLAGSFFGVMWSIQGDIDWVQSRYHLSDHRGGQPCPCCDANTSDLSWTDCTYPPRWLRRNFNKLSHAARFPNRHRMLRVLPGVSVLNHIPDHLHARLLGCDQYFLGSALALLTHYFMPDSPVQNLVKVWKEIKATYKRLKVKKNKKNA